MTSCSPGVRTVVLAVIFPFGIVPVIVAFPLATVPVPIARPS